MNAAADRVIQVAVERQAPARRGSAFEYGLGEVAGFRIQIRCAFSSSVPLWTVAEDAVALVERLPMLGVSDQFADVRLLAEARQTTQHANHGHCGVCPADFLAHSSVTPQKSKSKPIRKLSLTSSLPDRGA